MRMMRVQIPSVHPTQFWMLNLGFRIGRKFGVPQSKIRNQYEAVAERRMHFIVDEDDDGSSPFGLANFFGRLAETDQRQPEEPNSLLRYQERPPI